MKLSTKSIPKPWGQTNLSKIFGGERKKKIGEIWFQPPKGISLQLMCKYLFTSEKLSIQVHPDNRLARRKGLPHGKEECWYVLEAEPGAKLGIGLTKEVSSTKLRAAVACDQIEKLVDWKPVQKGDFFYIPAGTIHAIGAGLKIVEIQQNIDITYRLFDYGRPRELHIDDAIAAATPIPYDMAYHQHVEADKSLVLVDGPQFRVFQIGGDDTGILADVAASEWQITPLDGVVMARGKKINAGECGLCTNISEMEFSQNTLALVACNMK